MPTDVKKATTVKVANYLMFYIRYINKKRNRLRVVPRFYQSQRPCSNVSLFTINGREIRKENTTMIISLDLKNSK